MSTFPHHVTKRDAFLICVICALLGAVLSWIAFSSPDGVRVPREAGNAADWVAAVSGTIAAVATCVIGYAANSFTKAQADAGRERERRQNAILIQQMRAWVEILQRPHLNYQMFANGHLPGVRMNLSGACGLISGAAGVISLVPWDSTAWTLLGPSGVESWVDASGKAQMARETCQHFLKGHPDWTQPFDPQTTDGFQPMGLVFQVVHDAAIQLSAEIDRTVARLKASQDLH
ncbi:hypothetical protein [Stenotrophomonas indicatrix]|uniref:hypothetical protein n=1 Tax=Stenotrophomonas indicatrix TaxID=2045451 RepID=UPI0013EEC178|nr:hypothetical protein [Stenotrophomonas indicatrix]QII29103.1 hypothetical protein G6052_10335 [Stenotrophomonas maltophilia]